MKKQMIIASVAFGMILSACGSTAQPKQATESTSQAVETTESITEPESISETQEVEPPEESETEPAFVPEEFEVFILVEAKKIDETARFVINTNLPDETVLMVSLRRGDYNSEDHFTAQEKVTISNGKAVSSGFSNKGQALTGNYDLTISMSLPSLQSDAVREVIGQNGEYMVGPVVVDSSIGDCKVVEALFTFSADDYSVTSTVEYENTIFRDE